MAIKLKFGCKKKNWYSIVNGATPACLQVWGLRMDSVRGVVLVVVLAEQWAPTRKLSTKGPNLPKDIKLPRGISLHVHSFSFSLSLSLSLHLGSPVFRRLTRTRFIVLYRENILEVLSHPLRRLLTPFRSFPFSHPFPTTSTLRAGKPPRPHRVTRPWRDVYIYVCVLCICETAYSKQ